MWIPLASQSGSFIETSLTSNQLNISHADIPCVLENGIGGARSTQPVTLYITVNITPPNPYSSPPSKRTENDNSHVEATIPEPIQVPAPEQTLPPSPHQPVETGNSIPQIQEEVTPTSTGIPRLALDRADEDMSGIVPIDGSNTWERAVGRIKWAMDTLGPVAEVRVIPFSCP